MAFWSGETIARRARTERLIVPFKDEQIDCAAYTLRMGNEYYVTPDHRPGKIERFRKDILGAKKIVKLSEGDQFVIPAGQFAWLSVLEFIRVPNNVLALISLKTTAKYKGLINVSGFHVDPGFRGKLVYAVYNAGPQEIRLEQGQDLFLIWFADLDNHDTQSYRTKDAQQGISASFVIGGEIVSLPSLRTEIDALKGKVEVLMAGLKFVGFLIAVVAAIFAVPGLLEKLKALV